ncbi:MAG: hypothetical protein WBG61_07585, partial [Desulfobacterales bacterium]
STQTASSQKFIIPEAPLKSICFKGLNCYEYSSFAPAYCSKAFDAALLAESCMKIGAKLKEQ